MKFSSSNALLVMRREYAKWLINPRHVMLFLVFIPSRELIIKPMVEVSEKMGQPLGIFESCIATANSGIIIMVMTDYTADYRIFVWIRSCRPICITKWRHIRHCFCHFLCYACSFLPVH